MIPLFYDVRADRLAVTVQLASVAGRERLCTIAGVGTGPQRGYSTRLH